MAERVVIIFSEQGSDVVIKKIRGIGDASKSSGDAVSFLQNALGLLGAASTLKGLTGMLDAFVELQNRIRTVAHSEDEVAFSTKKLLDISNQTRTSLEDTATLYQRVSRSTQQLGVTNNEAARIVQTLNEAVIVGGASAREASAAIIQLSQGFQAGVLRGQELRSVMTQMPLVADILAKKLGTTIGGLLKLGPAGKITAKVMADALLEASDQIDKAFAKTTPTVSQQLLVLRNNAIKFVGDLNEKFQILPKITALIQGLSDHMDTFARIVLVGSFVVAVNKSIAVLNALTAALALNPIGAIAIAILAAAAAIIVFSDKIQLTTGSVATLSDFFSAFWEELSSDLTVAAGWISKWASYLSGIVGDLFGKDLPGDVLGWIKFVAKAADSIAGFFVGAKEAIVVAWKNLPAALEAVLVATINKVSELLQNLINFFVEAINFISGSALGKKLGLTELGQIVLPKAQMTAEAEDVGKAMGDAMAHGIASTHGAQDAIDRIAKRAGEIGTARQAAEQLRLERIKKGKTDADTRGDGASEELKRAAAINDVTERLNDENTALSKVIDNRRISSEYVRIELALKKQGVSLTQAETDQIQNLIERNRQLKEQQRQYDAIRGPAEDAARAEEALDSLYKSHKITLQEYIVQLRNVRIAQLETSRDTGSGFERGFLKLQDEITNFSTLTEKIITDTFHGMEDALVDFVKTGKVNFSGLVDSILSDLIRLTARLAISGIFNALASSGGGGGLGGILGSLVAGAATSGTRAAGGTALPGGAYLVGEKGPEIFSPETGGSIYPTGTGPVGQSQAPQVTVINVSDPNEVSAALNDPRVQDKIVNIVRTRKREIA